MAKKQYKQEEQLVYKVLKEHTNPYDSEIEVTGIVNIFTPRQLVADIEYNEKMITQIESNVTIKKATMENVSRTNPIVTKMAEKDLCAAYIYYECVAFNKEAKKKLDELKKQLEDDFKQLDRICKETGLKVERPKAVNKESLKS